ncbi:hypothetical protein AVEN_129949-1 [Araneus ventricosus]|uniref:Uncharacterized protein n=1 Tax=Araneus ventricosus TaxID=182803 RepID=A0A4Y2NQB2_ARAVE|nr:hypothetical protein AVEN_129949-1 [Araneus ventricosus]
MNGDFAQKKNPNEKSSRDSSPFGHATVVPVSIFIFPCQIPAGIREELMKAKQNRALSSYLINGVLEIRRTLDLYISNSPVTPSKFRLIESGMARAMMEREIARKDAHSTCVRVLSAREKSRRIGIIN